jgi:hypothetical protein
MTTIPISAVRQKENLWPILRLGDYRLATSRRIFFDRHRQGIAANDDSYTRKLNFSQVLEVVIRRSRNFALFRSSKGGQKVYLSNQQNPKFSANRFCLRLRR